MYAICAVCARCDISMYILQGCVPRYEGCYSLLRGHFNVP